MRKEYTVNYRSRWKPITGTHYNQCININESILDKLLDLMACERAFPRYKADDCTARKFLLTPIEQGGIGGRVYFLNLTQLDFFSKWLNKKLKKPLLKRNTILYLI